MDQPGKVANPARGQLNREINIFLSAIAPENLISRDGFGSPVSSRQPAHLHTQTEYRAYQLTGFFPSSAAASIYLFKSPCAIGPVPSLSGHAFAYRWRSLQRGRRYRASKPQCSPERVLPWQVHDLLFVVFFPIHSGHQVRWTYQPGSHRRKVTQDFSSTFVPCGACLNFSREKDSAIPFPRRP